MERCTFDVCLASLQREWHREQSYLHWLFRTLFSPPAQHLLPVFIVWLTFTSPLGLPKSQFQLCMICVSHSYKKNEDLCVQSLWPLRSDGLKQCQVQRMVLLQVKCQTCKLHPPHRPLWLLRQLWKTIRLLWQVSLTPLNLLPNVVMNWRFQDLLDEPLQQEKAARDTCWLAVCSRYVGHFLRGLLEEGCPGDTTEPTREQGWLLRYLLQAVHAALSMLVLLPLLKIKDGNYFEVKGSLCL